MKNTELKIRYEMFIKINYFETLKKNITINK